MFCLHENRTVALVLFLPDTYETYWPVKTEPLFYLCKPNFEWIGFLKTENSVCNFNYASNAKKKNFNCSSW